MTLMSHSGSQLTPLPSCLPLRCQRFLLLPLGSYCLKQSQSFRCKKALLPFILRGREWEPWSLSDLQGSCLPLQLSGFFLSGGAWGQEYNEAPRGFDPKQPFLFYTPSNSSTASNWYVYRGGNYCPRMLPACQVIAAWVRIPGGKVVAAAAKTSAFIVLSSTHHHSM